MVYKLYADIIPVKGYTRSLLFDLTKNNYWYISNELYEMLTKEIDFENLQELYPGNGDLLKSYKKFLQKNDLIFQVSHDETDAFPSIDMKWHSPSRITNMIIDVDAETALTSITKISREAGTLGVEAILFRCFSEKRLQELKKYIVYLNNDPYNRLRDIQLEISIPEYSNSKRTIADLREIAKLPMVSTVTVYTLNEQLLTGPAEDHKIQYVQKSVGGPENCGTIQGNIDSINLEIISESIHHNSCLNCKLSIDSAGNIKNCPSMTESFGNIKDTTLEESIHHKDFKRYWNLTKDDIEGCKDCEFRYVCTDCRAYTERLHTNEAGLDVSKPLKCGYNPYTGEWEEWSTNPLKQKAIQYYGMEKCI
ncbi:grasp-with-spasm system SPASM domain peptide maturase [Chryseobacterium sp. JJR-5R]|uniref:grasp-with-spasm system SPASM domain peptide maturase n=1 Tax=Chryseobacterium sp. JJR-5R TaxID=3093923 RepID=UPI002A762D4C|nr:grasp-with-spasm system SPASM domain peptide maturase [Chryseobacterium sp. JJR-5R]WPO83997.1 grasp-with-spasm system SPASM domain peptide maturase [Chryseobacterium sp. JJR-5R]